MKIYAACENIDTNEVEQRLKNKNTYEFKLLICNSLLPM